MRRGPSGISAALEAAALASVLAACAPSFAPPASGYVYGRLEGRQFRMPPPERAVSGVPRLRQVADAYLGVPYLWGGETMSGIDCSAFTQQVWRRAGGVNLPRTAMQQSRLGVRVFRHGLRPGDLVFFGPTEDSIEHVGLYMGASQFINATVSGGVRYSSLDDPYWQQRYRLARRPLP